MTFSFDAISKDIGDLIQKGSNNSPLYFYDPLSFAMESLLEDLHAITYHDMNVDFGSSVRGNVPILLSCPHGGLVKNTFFTKFQFQ